MRLVAALLTAAVAVPAFAAPTAQLTDVQYIEANRCLGILSSNALGTPADAQAMRAFLKTQEGARVGYIYDKADEARADALSVSGHAGAVEHQELVAERDGVCHSFIASAGPSSTAANGGGPNNALQ